MGPDTGTQCSAASLQAQVNDMETALARALNDLALIRRRAALDVSNAHMTAIADLGKALLAFKDAIEAAITVDTRDVNALRAGLELALLQLIAVLERSRRRIHELDTAQQTRVQP